MQIGMALLGMAVVVVVAAAAATTTTTSGTLSRPKTTVSVVELGRGGTVRRTTTDRPTTTTSVAAVKSFWAALHGQDWKRISSQQHAGMSLAPDLFRRADAGLVVGIAGLPAAWKEALPYLASLLEQQVGSLELEEGVGGVDLWGADAYGASLDTVEAVPTRLASVAVSWSDAPEALDRQLQALVKRLSPRDGTTVLHLVLEHSPPETATTHRRLEDDAANDDDAGDDGQQDAAEGGNEDDAASSATVDCTGLSDQQCNDKKNQEKYKRKAKDGTTITIYRSMFEIQFTNVVLWTAVALTAMVLFTMGHLTHMPLMPDTLLFGESGKMTGSAE